ncbi:MAG: exodeoxyribonuclease VII small subunit [Tannerella sp.]|jgi:exodeoxyribonuclease VII small subunit|nr:exodeoxyribonuclease VII small subunit [Tannerella sp.]
MEEKESYSESITKLHAILADIEQGELDIDELLKKVEEANRLIRQCKEKLFRASDEVKKILEELQ